MAEVKINILEVEESTFTMRLEGKSYHFHTKWNPVSENWYLEMDNSDSETITEIIKVVAEFPLIRTNSHEFPDGYNLYCFSEKGAKELRRDNFGVGKDFELYFGVNGSGFLTEYNDVFPSYPEEGILQSPAKLQYNRAGVIQTYEDFYKL